MQIELSTPTFIPLSEAIKKTNIPEQVLTQQIQEGKLEAVNIAGVLFVSKLVTTKTKEQIIKEEFAHLQKIPISASEASRKYSEIHKIPISQPNFSRWSKSGYIEVLERGWQTILDEADVAYCAKVYAEKYRQYKGQMQGVSVFDNDGNPYHIKNEQIARQKRAERRLNQ